MKRHLHYSPFQSMHTISHIKDNARQRSQIRTVTTHTQQGNTPYDNYSFKKKRPPEATVKAS